MHNGRWRIPAVLLAATASIVLALDAHAAQRFKWWQSGEVQEEVGLTAEQQADLEAIFQAIRPELRELMQRLEREEDELSRIMHAMQAEEWEVGLQIDKVEAARSVLSKTRTLMLYRMHRTLTDEQLDALHAMWERRRASGQRSPHNRK